MAETREQSFVPPDRHDSSPTQSNRHKKPNRLLQALGVTTLVGALIVTTNSAITELQDSRPPTVQSIDTNPSSKDRIVTFAGFNGFAEIEGNGQAVNDLACTVDAFDDRNVYTVNHNGEFNLDKIADILSEKSKADEVESLTFHGVSAGGLMALKVGSMLADRDVKVAEIHLVTPPIELSDVKVGDVDRRTLEYINRALGITGIDALLELGMNTATEFFFRNNSDSNSKKLGSAFKRTLAVPIDVVRGQSKLLIDGAQESDIANLIEKNPSIKFVLFLPNEDGQDSIVNSETANQHFRNKIANIVGQDQVENYLNVVRAGNGHAYTTHSENRFINGVWVNYTNATSANSLTTIEGLASLYPGCTESYEDVAYTLANGDYSQ